MPLYEYNCESCEHSFELLSSVGDMNKPVKKPCPECGEKKIKKGFGVPITGANANVTVEKMCPGFTRRMEQIANSPVANRQAKKNISESLNMKPSGHLRPN